jgi:hypothetical protein
MGLRVCVGDAVTVLMIYLLLLRSKCFVSKQRRRHLRIVTRAAGPLNSTMEHRIHFLIKQPAEISIFLFPAIWTSTLRKRQNLVTPRTVVGWTSRSLAVPGDFHSDNTASIATTGTACSPMSVHLPVFRLQRVVMD